MDRVTDAKRRLRGWLARFPALLALARLTVETIRICLRYRVTGLASEAGFFALLSLPPLVLGLFGGVGYVGRWLGQDTVEQVRVAVSEYAARFLTEDVISTTLVADRRRRLHRRPLRPHLRRASCCRCGRGRGRSTSSSTPSRSCTASPGCAGIVPTRALSFSLYVVALLVGVVMIPLVLIGPTLLGQFLPRGLGLPHGALLAGRLAARHRRLHEPLPRVHAAPEPVDPGPPGGLRHPRHLGRGVVRGARDHRRLAGRARRSTARSARRSCCSSGSTCSPSPSSSAPPSTPASATSGRPRSSAGCGSGSPAGSGRQRDASGADRGRRGGRGRRRGARGRDPTTTWTWTAYGTRRAVRSPRSATTRPSSSRGSGSAPGAEAQRVWSSRAPSVNVSPHATRETEWSEVRM